MQLDDFTPLDRSDRDKFGRRYSEGTRRRARHLRKSGKTIRQVATEIGATPQTIRKWLRAAEHESARAGNFERLLPGQKERVFDRAKILADLDLRDSDGKRKYSQRQLAQKYGCSIPLVSKLANGKLLP